MQLWEPHHIPGNRAKWTGTVRFEGAAGTGADGQLLSHTSCASNPSKAAQPRFLLASNFKACGLRSSCLPACMSRSAQPPSQSTHRGSPSPKGMRTRRRLLRQRTDPLSVRSGRRTPIVPGRAPRSPAPTPLCAPNSIGRSALTEQSRCWKGENSDVSRCQQMSADDVSR